MHIRIRKVPPTTGFLENDLRPTSPVRDMRTCPVASRKRAHAWGYAEPNMDRDDLDHANDKRRRD